MNNQSIRTVSTEAEFVFAVLSGVDVIRLKADITVSDELRFISGRITSDTQNIKRKLTFTKTVSLDYYTEPITFSGLNIVSTAPDVAFSAAGGSNIHFEECTLTIAARGFDFAVCNRNYYVSFDLNGGEIQCGDTLIKLDRAIANITANATNVIHICKDCHINCAHVKNAPFIIGEGCEGAIFNVYGDILYTAPRMFEIMGSNNKIYIDSLALTETAPIHISGTHGAGSVTVGKFTGSGKFALEADSIGSNGEPGGYALMNQQKASRSEFALVSVENPGDKLQTIIQSAATSKCAVKIGGNPITCQNLAFDHVKSIFISANITARNITLCDATICIDAGVTVSADVVTIDVGSGIFGDGTLIANGSTVKLPRLGPYVSRVATGPLLGTVGGSGTVGGEFDNKLIQMMIDKFGDRIFKIIFDNSISVTLGYSTGSVQSVDDIILEHANGCDLIGFREYVPHPRNRTKMMSYVTWHPTHCIQFIGVMDDYCADERVDIMLN